jgi:hypothetical protein
MRVVSGFLSYNQRNNNAERTDRTDDCPYSGDPIEATGSPELIRPDTALGNLVLFLTAMYFSYKGLKRRRFVLPNAICWLLAAGRGRGVRLLPGGRADNLAFRLALDVAKRLPLGRPVSD